MRMAMIGGLALSALCAIMVNMSAHAQGVDDSRAVRILGSEPPSEKPNAGGAPAAAMIDQESLTAENPAGLSVDIQPGTELTVGSKVTFRITAKKAGYLVLIDVDATGRVRQIYPSPESLLAPGAASQISNRMRPSETVTVPDAKNPFAGFEYVVSPPTGVAMIVAILGDRPVQVLDLPDVPTTLTGHAEALKFLTDSARTLRIAQNDEGRRFAQPTWSFAARFYVVK